MGLIPYWTKDAKGGRKPINNKSETVASLPSFREARKRRRGFWPSQEEVGGIDASEQARHRRRSDLTDTVGRGCARVDRRSSALALAMKAREQGTPSLPWGARVSPIDRYLTPGPGWPERTIRDRRHT